MPKYLYSRDAKDKVRVLILTTKKHTENGKPYFTIQRQTGLLGGKLTDQPLTYVRAGKVKRTIVEQVELEFRSIVNKQRDKGYKLFEELLQYAPEVTAVEGYEANALDYDFIDSILPKGKTYADGGKKLMLCKDPKTVKSKAGFNWRRDWWVSRKLDGIRAAVYYNDEGKLTSTSRNGKCMDPAFEKIFKSKKWKTFFKKLQKNADDDDTGGIMVDGELYIHGVPLQTLSGLSQKKDYDEDRHGELEFWIFDFADESRTAGERALLLNSLYDHFDEKEDKIRINQQCLHSEYEYIKVSHDQFVKQGFEGAVCRDASRLYGYGTRDDRMVKLKEFDETEFKIIGLNDENKRLEDMTFECLLPDGQTFKCKPHGTRAMKYRFIEDFENIVGKMMTVKHFGYTPDGIPFINTGKCIRDYE